jgi:NTE family protein
MAQGLQPEAEPMGATLRRDVGQIVLVLQGGGALGAFQVGVYQALHEAGIEPDWVIGTSIGAINASLIAGNTVPHRLARLLEFWRRVEHNGWQKALAAVPFAGRFAATCATLTQGIGAFFTPNPWALGGLHMPLGPEAAAYYSTDALRTTLRDLVDFRLINGGNCRLTVGAANVRTSEMRYFDSRDMELDVRHVMASGALPPGFPAIRIGEDLYWDGGLLSNTPVEAVFDDNPRRDSLVFAVHIWNPHGREPGTIWDVMNRQKDLQYCSRALSHITRQKQLHRLRHIIAEMATRLPEELRHDPEMRAWASHGCLTRMHVVRLLAPNLDGEDHTKDIDFSAAGIRARREAGYEHTQRVLRMAPWQTPSDGIEGFILHEASPAAGIVTT